MRQKKVWSRVGGFQHNESVNFHWTSSVNIIKLKDTFKIGKIVKGLIKCQICESHTKFKLFIVFLPSSMKQEIYLISPMLVGGKTKPFHCIKNSSYWPKLLFSWKDILTVIRKLKIKLKWTLFKQYLSNLLVFIFQGWSIFWCFWPLQFWWIGFNWKYYLYFY